MFNFDYITKEGIKQHNLRWTEIPDNPYGILIIGGFGSRKTNAWLNLINHEPDIDKIYLYDPYKAKYQLLINERKSTGSKYLNDLEVLLDNQMIWIIFTKKLKNKNKIKNGEY